MAQKGVQYWRVSWTVLLVVMYLSMGQAEISTNCMKCICELGGNCEDNLDECDPDDGSIGCGPYHITEPYWIDCGAHGDDYESCAKKMDCSETCVKDYMKRWAPRCTRGEHLTCDVYARIHHAGPRGCRQQPRRTETLLRAYVKRVEKCCLQKGGC